MRRIVLASVIGIAILWLGAGAWAQGESRGPSTGPGMMGPMMGPGMGMMGQGMMGMGPGMMGGQWAQQMQQMMNACMAWMGAQQQPQEQGTGTRPPQAPAPQEPSR